MRLPDGRQVPVAMDQSRGGYGFWDSAGRWILLSSILNNSQSHGYQPQYAASPDDESPSSSAGARAGSSRGGGGGFLSIVGLLVLAFLIFGGISAFRMAGASRPRAGSPAHLAAALGNKPPPAPEPGQKLSPLESWKRLEPGAFVTLSDQQAIEDSQKRGQGVRGIDYSVEQVGIATDFDGFATWVFAFLNDGHQKLLLMVKGNDAHVEHRVYYATEDFRPAKRENVLVRGDRWLFAASSDGLQPKVSHLQYAAEIPYSIGRHELLYIRKDHGERHCEYTEKPPVPGLGSLVATVVEYSTSDSTENPELLILEIATAKNKTGEVALYLGCPVRESEVDIVKASGAGSYYA